MYGDGVVLYWAELHLCQSDTVAPGVGPHRYCPVVNASRGSVDFLLCLEQGDIRRWARLSGTG